MQTAYVAAYVAVGGSFALPTPSETVVYVVTVNTSYTWICKRILETVVSENVRSLIRRSGGGGHKCTEWFDEFALGLPWWRRARAQESPKTAPRDAQYDPQELLTARPRAQ